MQLASPSTEPTCGRAAAPLIAPARCLARSGQRDVAEALDAVGLAQHVADLAVERQRLLVARARLLVVRAPQRDVAEAAMQFASPSTSPTRR